MYDCMLTVTNVHIFMLIYCSLLIFPIMTDSYLFIVWVANSHFFSVNEFVYLQYRKNLFSVIGYFVVEKFLYPQENILFCFIHISVIDKAPGTLGILNY